MEVTQGAITRTATADVTIESVDREDSGQSLGSSTSRDVSLGDVDGDGDLDAFVANQFQGNRVWLNDGSGSFTNS